MNKDVYYKRHKQNFVLSNGFFSSIISDFHLLYALLQFTFHLHLIEVKTYLYQICQRQYSEYKIAKTLNTNNYLPKIFNHEIIQTLTLTEPIVHLEYNKN